MGIGVKNYFIIDRRRGKVHHCFRDKSGSVQVALYASRETIEFPHHLGAHKAPQLLDPGSPTEYIRNAASAREEAHKQELDAAEQQRRRDVDAAEQGAKRQRQRDHQRRQRHREQIRALGGNPFSSSSDGTPPRHR